MLLDGSGRQVFEYRKPPELADSYTLQQVAGFTRWYLSDYPVRVRFVDEGLLVMGGAKNSVWKYSFEVSVPMLSFWPLWAAAVLLCNFLLILAVSALTIERSYKKRDAARTQWIAAVSHDVRTPLATVLGYAGSLEADPALPPEQREQAGLIRVKAQQLRRLIEDLNLTNRLEHSMEPLEQQWFSPAAAVREAVVAFINDESFAAYDITADISPEASILLMLGDKALIMRMLNNLIGNSLSHNPGGCRVSAALALKGRALVLRVSDSGSGYSREQLKKLSSKEPPLTSGHGLGLTIARQVAAAHRGRVSFSNAPQGGAVCRIVFRAPLKRRRQAEPD